MSQSFILIDHFQANLNKYVLICADRFEVFPIDVDLTLIYHFEMILIRLHVTLIYNFQVDLIENRFERWNYQILEI